MERIELAGSLSCWRGTCTLQDSGTRLMISLPSSDYPGPILDLDSWIYFTSSESICRWTSSGNPMVLPCFCLLSIGSNALRYSNTANLSQSYHSVLISIPACLGQSTHHVSPGLPRRQRWRLVRTRPWSVHPKACSASCWDCPLGIWWPAMSCYFQFFWNWFPWSGPYRSSWKTECQWKDYFAVSCSYHWLPAPYWIGNWSSY